ncbi:MAG: exodeoxyribonuclease VII large subunit [Bacteroidales bacterium]|nr:exodeoxyribonuclease VII large subunit [Bacteroidales bacterium]MCF8457063.1 exodeoxyribonuclease VII large subunit [Bacteroidales bacterium]
MTEEQSKIGLYQLNQMVKGAIYDAFPSTLWIVAEISEIRFNRNGHCYLELIEKDEGTDNIIAKSRAAIWARTCNILKPYFEMTTGQALSAGMKVLVRVSVDFHELYSFNLTIHDIDPAYTIGDLARRRQEIITRLEEEGIFNMNKETDMPLVPQRVAIISSETAAGLGDFLNQLNNNSYNIIFYPKLFPAVVQGSKAEESIMQAFDRIYQYEDFFDVVCLIRGGGSKADLSCFDSYDLAYYITQFPLPVITGIGHERDDSIADMVAHTRMKTPTAVAEFLIERASNFELALDELQEKIVDEVSELMRNEKNRINHLSLTFAPGVKDILNLKKSILQHKAHRFQRITTEFVRKQELLLHDFSLDAQHLFQKNIFQKRTELEGIKKLLPIRKNRFLLNKYHQLEMAENSNEHLNPSGILKRGYSLTFKNGQVLKSSGQLKSGDEIVSRLYQGEIVSEVKGVME